MSEVPVLYWFRQDLRLADNPALRRAAAVGAVLPVFIWDQAVFEQAAGAASRWWLHQSLAALQRGCEGRLRLLAGSTVQLLPQLAAQTGARLVVWNRAFEPAQLALEVQVRERLQQQGVRVECCEAATLWPASQLGKADGTAYQVFSAFHRHLQALGPPPAPLPSPVTLRWHGPPAAETAAEQALSALELLPRLAWYQGFGSATQVGEAAAWQRLQQFLRQRLSGYASGRDLPAREQTSGLAAALHWGEISPRQIWAALAALPACDDGAAFLRQLVWREFCYAQLHFWPQLPWRNLRAAFDRFPWQTDSSAAALRCWQQGQTGYPLVDAGMRQLWHSGTLHNRVRMVTASFLVKNLLFHWRLGQRWFHDGLLDADLACNSANWQWVAGCGLDAAPYFRIFNPVAQGQRFDADGAYTRRWLPELARLPQKYLFCPWQAPPAVLRQAGVVLGQHYPLPLVDLATSRQQALAAFAHTKAAVAD
ncbi:MAG: deoxyribodipyrimidine photo-lyase [Desulfuromonas thiophila]|nr:deoxyribodipyrimidine photo-lyase [Desulfuromonas thiophila]